MASSIMNRLHEIREDHARRRTLWRELSAYQTTDALNDLEAAIARSETEAEPETQEIRRILAAQRIAVLQRG
jgi:cell division protein FtsL